MTWSSNDPAAAGAADHARLRELGYKQELKRHLSYAPLSLSALLTLAGFDSIGFFFVRLTGGRWRHRVLSNFSISFSIISVLTGVTTLYSTGLAFGGPAAMTLGWFLPGAFTMAVGLSMAEICSAFPTSGGLYFWSARLAGHRWAPFASWITGWYVYVYSSADHHQFLVSLIRWAPFASWITGWWMVRNSLIRCVFVIPVTFRFNIVAQWAGTASVDFSLAQLIQVIILLSTGGSNGGGYVASKYAVFAFHAGILLSHAIINSLSITWLSFFGQLAAAWNMIGVFVLMITVPLVATERASAKFVFTHFNTDNSAGIHSRFYIFILGLLMSQYTLTGYDASAHLTEETKTAAWNGPIGIVSSIGISLVVGWGYILGITFAVTDVPHLLSPDNDAGGYAIAEVFYLAFKGRYGNGTGGIACLGVVAVAIYFCGMSSVTSNSRMTYAFSRDGAMPFSSVWHKVNKQDVPINAVWLSAFVSLCMALPSLGSLVAFQAMASVSTMALCIAYALPILFRVTLARRSFVEGPFSLGRYSVAVGWAAVLWVATITVLFSLPVAYPVTKDTLNYTPVAVGGLFILVVLSWIAGARRWFEGPVTNLDGEGGVEL
ncbi:hypothetical protein U9M48_005379 [Paspalum notatum var. saurae]|uniref:Amino acid transporter n=1 Tax=Paspalum notatum var. saurae TaxID=547442 RepID=A0AAQ3PS43_PASNO